MVIIAHMVMGIAVLTGATVLCALGKLQSDSLVVLYTAAIALIAGNAKSLGDAAINGGPKPDLTKLAESDPRTAERVTLGTKQATDLPQSQEQPMEA